MILEDKVVAKKTLEDSEIPEDKCHHEKS